MTDLTRFVPIVLVLLVACDASSIGGSNDASGGRGDDDDAPPGFADADPNATGDNDAGPQGNCGSLEATVRDFQISHPDFEEDVKSDFPYLGLVKYDLGADDKPVYAPNGAVPVHTSGPASFAQWYHDVSGVNMAFPYTIPLTEQGGGVSGFSSNAFFPLDGRGYGNEGLPHNFHFTTEVHTSFKYEGGESFTFKGDDDLWLFINRKLAIDLGGLHPEATGTVNLDQKAAELGLQIGGTYHMDIFHAERHTEASNFQITTTIDCFTIP